MLLSLALARQASAQPYVYGGTKAGTSDRTGLYVLPFASRIVAVDTATGEVISSFATGCSPNALTFKPDGSRLFTLCSTSTGNSVLAIDPATNTTVASAAAPDAVVIRIVPDGSTLLIPDINGNKVRLIDSVTLALKRDLSVAGPADVAVTGDGAKAYVVSNTTAGANLVAFDLATGATVATIQLASSGSNISLARSGSRGIVTHPNGLATIIETSGNTAVAQVRVATASFTVVAVGHPVVDPTGSRAYVPVSIGTATGTVVVDLAGSQIATTLTGGMPFSAAMSPAGDRLYTGEVDPIPAKLSVFDASSGTLLRAVTVAGGLLALAAAPAGVSPPITPCTYSIARLTRQFMSSGDRPPSHPGGSSGRIGVTALPDRCAWSPSSDVPWITFDAASGVGIATVGYTIAANNTGASRTGHVTIGGETLTFVQEACSDPVIVVETPKSGSTVGQPFHLSGYAIDRCSASGTGIGGLLVTDYLSGGYGIPRADVAATYGPQFQNSGFDVVIGREDAGGQRTVVVTFSVLRTNTILSASVDVTASATARPFGVIDTPAEGTTVAGELALTGWGLDDIGLSSVNVYRDAVAGESSGVRPDGRVLIGSATRVAGARPDVAAAFPGINQNTAAGYGLMVLTNVLPNGGNGTFRFTVDLADGAGIKTLGPRTVVADNSGSQIPFGTIDTPGQGAAVSGTIVNFGWVLAPGGNVIPTDGSTIDVVIDGVVVGHPVYNQFRSDIANAFPGHANSSGAVGYFILDTRTLANGVHTIGWIARDAAGRAAGLGSRFFTVANP